MRTVLAAAALAMLLGSCGKTPADERRPVSDDGPAVEPAGAPQISPGAANAPGPAVQPAAPNPSRRLLRFEPTVIVDATGFDRPIGAATMFIPHGWKTEGGVFWASDFMCTNGYNIMWRATSPDGAMSLGIFPQTAWEFHSTGAGATRPGCQAMQIGSARDYLAASVQRSVPGARILDYRDRPDLVREIGFQSSRTPMPMGETQRWAEGGEILFAFSENGLDMRGALAAVVQFDKMTTDMSSMYQNDPTIVAMPNAAQLRTESLSAYAHPGFVATAPNGRLNLGFFESLRKTISPNPQWASKIAGHNAAIGRVALEESRKRAAMIAETNDYVSRLREETWAAQQKSADRRAREFGELIKGVETYDDADAPGGQVELSSTYNRAWRLNDGSYVLTDDPNFDPWRDLQMEGKQLEAAQ